MRVFLIDDEPDSIEVMSSLLMECFSGEVEIVGTATSAREAYPRVLEIKPDLVFLDINMPKENGFTFLKKFDNIDFEIIFVTSYDEYPLNAIKFSALDYLLKPVMVNDLKEAVMKAKKVVGQKTSRQLQVLNLITNLESDGPSQKIAVHHADEVRFLKLGDILYFEAEGRYTKIHLLSGEQLMTVSHLKVLDESLEATGLFVRVNKSYLINIDHLVAYSKNEPYYLQLAGDKMFEVARRKRQEVLEKLKDKKLRLKP